MALTEWLKIGDAASLQGANLAQHPLVMAALNGLASESAFDEAVDATVELVYSTSSGGQPEPSMLPLVSVIVPSVSTLPPRKYRIILEVQVMLHPRACLLGGPTRSSMLPLIGPIMLSVSILVPVENSTRMHVMLC